MKIKLELNAQDITELSDSETSKHVREMAHDMIDEMLNNRDDYIKCTISINEAGEIK